MSKSQKLKNILEEARQQEKEYDWIAAAKSYDSSLKLALDFNEPPKAGELYEKIGFCHRRVAMQADNKEAFDHHMNLVIEAYEKAASLYEKLEGGKAEACRCSALANYGKYWLAPTSTQKKEMLNDYHKLKTKVFKLYEKARESAELGKAYNELLMCLCESDSDRATLEWDWSKWEEMIKEALTYGEKAITTFSHLREGYQLAMSYALTGKLYETARHVSELEEAKKEFGQKSLRYLQAALKLCKKVDDQHLSSWVNIWLGISIADWTGNLKASSKYFKKAKQSATKTGNHYLIGHAAHCLAYVIHWISVLEQDPDKRKRGFNKAIVYEEQALRNFHASSFVPISFWILPESYSALAEGEADPEAKLDFLQKAVKAGRESLRYASLSGYFPRPDWGVYHGLSKALYYLSTVKVEASEKRRLCEESLGYREESVRIVEQATPFDYWNIGVFRNYLALINVELATIEADKLKKQDLLQKATESMEKCLESCLRRLKISPKASLYVTVGNYHENYAKILNRLYSLTDKPEYLKKAIEIYQGAIDAYDKIGRHNYIAETDWRIATIYDQLNRHLDAAKSFQRASEEYGLAADETAPFRAFYSSYASYMRAWSEIEKGRYHHAEKQYGQAREHYEKAAKLHQSVERWKYLTSNYLAWATLEEAEDLSRKERTEEAIDLFRQAAELFREARQCIETKLETVEVRAEREMAAELVKASDTRREYCTGRIALEEAKILDRHGDHRGSSKKYGSAAGIFQEIAEVRLDQQFEEIQAIVCLCQAWEKMMMAEVKTSSTMYKEAAELFRQAKEHTVDQPTSLLALANSSFCKALETGTEFEITHDSKLHSATSQHLESAANYYLKAGFKTGSAYAKATQRLFDAYIYMNTAKKETDPKKKAKYYQMAEKLLQASAESFTKAKHPEKSEEVARLLDDVKEEQELAVSLAEVLHPPTIASTTASFSTPTPTQEQAVGIERFEHAHIQANLLFGAREAKVGQDLDLEMELVNAGKASALLIKVEAIIPAGFEIRRAPKICRVEDRHLNMKGRRLAPLQMEEIRLVLRPTTKGTFVLRPRIVYLDEMGECKFHEPEPVTVKVKELGILGWIKGER